MEKKIEFYETDLVSIIKRIAREEIATTPTFQTFTKPGDSSTLRGFHDDYTSISLGHGGLSSGKAY